MPIPIPNLDDRNYDQLLRETGAVIARYFPDYADIGPSDPAVAMNELFCYFFDIMMYQLNRVTPDARDNFAALLGVKPVYGQPPEEALRKAHAKLSRIDRAITAGDIETLVKKATLDERLFSEPVLRALALPGESAGDPLRIYVVQQRAFRMVAKRHKQDLRNLYSYLRGCSPIGTRYLIAHSWLLNVAVSAEIVKRRDTTISSDKLAEDIKKKLSEYIHPLTGGAERNGWPFSKALSRGEIYSIIESMPGVDYVRSLSIKMADDPYDDSADVLTLPEGGLFQLRKSNAVITVS